MQGIRVLLGFLFAFSAGWCQGQPYSFSAIDRQVLLVDAATPDSLAAKLTAPYATDKEKVRAIFRWITENIAYQVRNPISSTRSYAHRFELDASEDTASVLKPLNLRVAEAVLRKRMGVCEGYARLFKTLCDYAGIRSEIICGYARGDINRIGKTFRSNHTWNSVFFDGTWHLLDVTWASGFITFHSNEFVKQYDDSYFLTPPEQFIRDHYPEDLHWTLLPDPPTLKEFEFTPFKLAGFVRHKVLSFAPRKGIIEAAVGDSIQFEVETPDIPKNFRVAASPHIDSLLSDLVEERLIPAQAPYTVNGRKVRFTFPVDSEALNWLYIIYNDEVIMRYKLNIKSNKVVLK